jgi:hypothetical protein
VDLLSQIVFAIVTVRTRPSRDDCRDVIRRTSATTILPSPALLAWPRDVTTDVRDGSEPGRDAWMLLIIDQGVRIVVELVLWFFVIPDGPPTPPSLAEFVKQQQQ